MKKKFYIKPLRDIYDLSQAGFNANPQSGQWPCMNVMVSSNRVERRWDQELFRSFDSQDVIQAAPIFRTNTGTSYVLALTGTDLVKLMGGSGETYQYLTQTWTTGSVSNVVTTAVTGASEANQWYDSSGVEAGDKFIMDDDHSAAVEPDTHWATVASVESNTGLTLSAAYGGSDTSGAYKLRKVYSCPVGERWQYAAVNGKFCFVNGSVYGQYWNGTDTYATDINTTYCSQVRYCVAFANRLITADMQYSGSRNQHFLRWSKEGDPTDWTDSTAGYQEFIDTEEPITGLGVSGTNLIVFKKNSYYIGYRTGEATSPIAFPSHKKGIGLYAPYSLVHAGGTVAWMGINDFYFLNGDNADSIGDPIREKFFELVADDELESVWGWNNQRYNELHWVANTSGGQYDFVYNWKEKCWTTYQFSDTFTGGGGYGGV